MYKYQIIIYYSWRMLTLLLLIWWFRRFGRVDTCKYSCLGDHQLILKTQGVGMWVGLRHKWNTNRSSIPDEMMQTFGIFGHQMKSCQCGFQAQSARRWQPPPVKWRTFASENGGRVSPLLMGKSLINSASTLGTFGVFNVQTNPNASRILDLWHAGKAMENPWKPAGSPFVPCGRFSAIFLGGVWPTGDLWPGFVPIRNYCASWPFSGVWAAGGMGKNMCLSLLVDLLKPLHWTTFLLPTELKPGLGAPQGKSWHGRDRAVLPYRWDQQSCCGLSAIGFHFPNSGLETDFCRETTYTCCKHHTTTDFMLLETTTIITTFLYQFSAHTHPHMITYVCT